MRLWFNQLSAGLLESSCVIYHGLNLLQDDVYCPRDCVQERIYGSRICTPLQHVCLPLGDGAQAVDAAIQDGEGLERTIEDLLPGLLNEITLHHIVSKLSWRDFYILSAVSPAWRHAARSGLVHEARARLHPAVTVVPVIYSDRAIALYCSTRNSWHQLPPVPVPVPPDRRFQFLPWDTLIPNRRRVQFSARGRCVSMDGKIYVFGGSKDSSVGWTGILYCQLYAFDLARLGNWEQLAGLSETRHQFACGVKDGRIYVFGGESRARRVAGSVVPLYVGEVYDSEENRWLPIKPMTCPRFHHSVETVGEELFVVKGSGSPNYFDLHDPRSPLKSAEAYHPGKDRWRVVKSFWKREQGGGRQEMFTAGGKLFSTRSTDWDTPVDFRVYNVHRGSWRVLHSFSLAAVLRKHYDEEDEFVTDIMDDPTPSLIGIQAVGDEVLAIVAWRSEERELVLCLVQSKGFGSTDTQISWQIKALSSMSSPDFTHRYAPRISCCPCRF